MVPPGKTLLPSDKGVLAGQTPGAYSPKVFT